MSIDKLKNRIESVTGDVAVEASFVTSTSEQFGEDWMLSLADELGYESVRFEGADPSVGIQVNELVLVNPVDGIPLKQEAELAFKNYSDDLRLDEVRILDDNSILFLF